VEAVAVVLELLVLHAKVLMEHPHLFQVQDLQQLLLQVEAAVVLEVAHKMDFLVAAVVVLLV
jgi:hypothetical protein